MKGTVQKYKYFMTNVLYRESVLVLVFLSLLFICNDERFVPNAKPCNTYNDMFSHDSWHGSVCLSVCCREILFPQRMTPTDVVDLVTFPVAPLTFLVLSEMSHQLFDAMTFFSP